MISKMEKFRDDYFICFGEKYDNHVNKVIEYLWRINKLNAPTNMDLTDVKHIVKYYLESHFELIKSFYDYLRENGKARDIQQKNLLFVT